MPGGKKSLVNQDPYLQVPHLNQLLICAVAAAGRANWAALPGWGGGNRECLERPWERLFEMEGELGLVLGVNRGSLCASNLGVYLK